MPLHIKLVQILKLILLGSFAGLLILFFVPNSPASFNWVEVKKAWDFYQQSSRKAEKSSNHNLGKSEPFFSFSTAVAKAGPSVVSIQARYSGQRARPARNGRKGDVLVDFPVMFGSGVIVDGDGYIVTNYHVIAGSEVVSVHFPSGLYKKAEVVGADQKNDIAVLKVNIKTPNVADLGRSSEVKTGDIVLAIGTPYGVFENSVTSGIVSSIDHGPLYPKIQTDAAISDGNSGGALVNVKGQVIGISSAKFVKRHEATNINFGIPIDIVKEIFKEIKSHGRVIRNWLGVQLHQLKKPRHTQLDPGIAFGTGLLVVAVEKGSPSELSGLLPNDFIIQFDGGKVENMIQFRTQFFAIPIGKKVEVEVLRKKKLVKLSLQLKERPTPLFNQPAG